MPYAQSNAKSALLAILPSLHADSQCCICAVRECIKSKEWKATIEHSGYIELAQNKIAELFDLYIQDVTVFVYDDLDVPGIEIEHSGRYFAFRPASLYEVELARAGWIAYSSSTPGGWYVTNDTGHILRHSLHLQGINLDELNTTKGDDAETLIANRLVVHKNIILRESLVHGFHSNLLCDAAYKPLTIPIG
jgi:hypothetical protein